MCKCCQHCLESCYWHLIEERFCFDKEIALYKDPTAAEKNEKNNNSFENAAFFDSVSVIAGRAIVTIDPFPVEKDEKPIVQQPRRLKWFEDNQRNEPFKKPLFSITDQSSSGEESAVTKDEVDTSTKENVDFDKKLLVPQLRDNPSRQEAKERKKSLRERRMSKSLHLVIDGQQKEIPIIRQASMPKFFLDTPQANQTDSALVRSPLESLRSPISDGFTYDLFSVVQIEKSKSQSSLQDMPQVHKNKDSPISRFKDKLKLKKTKSNVTAGSLPHSNYI